MDLQAVNEHLRETLGGKEWWRAGGPLEVMVGAVLTQQTTWNSVEVAMERLKEKGLLSLNNLAAAPPAVLEECVRPTRFGRVKARRLRAMATRILKDCGSLRELFSKDSVELRQYLLRLRGIGFETADSILLYAAGRPFMVVDSYTRRIVGRLGMALPSDYEEARLLLQRELPRSVEGYREFHASLVELGKRYCRRNPHCNRCPLQDRCPHGSKVIIGINGS